jgi:hypothetical protein
VHRRGTAGQETNGEETDGEATDGEATNGEATDGEERWQECRSGCAARVHEWDRHVRYRA